MPLWFGLWKNSESMYVLAWMKADTKTYFRVKKVNGEPINTISPLCEAEVEKDAAAFAKIMAHIREVDEEESTVIIMQVENEIAHNKFLIAGMMSTLTFRPKDGDNLKVDYLNLEEGRIENGEWKSGRILNGDERMSLKLGEMPSCLCVELYKY